MSLKNQVLRSLLDRGSLKWPSDCVLEAIISLWKIFVKIEQNDHLMLTLIAGPSRKIIIQLAIDLIEENQSESWRERCTGCNAFKAGESHTRAQDGHVTGPTSLNLCEFREISE